MLVDKAVFPRDKICGDALSGKVVEVMKKLDPAYVDLMSQDAHNLDSWGVTFVAPNGMDLRVPFISDKTETSHAPGFISKRMDFDNFLVEQVRKEPLIDLREGIELRKFAYVDGGIEATSKNGDDLIQAELIIAADGAYSVFAKQMGNLHFSNRDRCFGLRAYYEGVEGLDVENFIELHFVHEALPGYFWIFPLPNGLTNVGLGMRSDVIQKKKVHLKRLLEEVIHQNPLIAPRFKNAELQGTIQQFPLPMGSRKQQLSGDRFMLLGDAGYLIDPFTGEGIGNAMMSAMIAAQQVRIVA